MINNVSIIGMYIQLLISLLFPIILIIVCNKKKVFAWKPFFTGIGVFVIFSQILEKMLHLLVIDSTGTSLKWTSNPYIFALYASLAAGLFEEFGRYLGFKFLLRKKQLQYKDGLSYGLGHGGIEAVLVGTIVAINSIVMASAINAGNFEQLLGSKIPIEQVLHLKEQIIIHDFWYYFLGSLERICAMCVQIALSLLVLFGVLTRKFKFIVLSIALHAFGDFFAGLYQAGVIKSIWSVEIIVYIFAILSIIFIVKSKMNWS